MATLDDSREQFDAQLAEWQLTPDGPLDRGRALVQPVRTVDHRRAVLKLATPDGWHAGQVAALKAWQGTGAAEVLRARPSTGALLLEPLEPAALWGDQELDTLAALWRRLHRPAPAALPRLDALLAPELAALDAPGGKLGVPPRLARQAVVAGRRLLSNPSPPAMLHGNLHAGHVMLRGDEPVAIAPLGLAGDPLAEAAAAFDTVAPQAPAVQDHFWALLDALAAAGIPADERALRDWTVLLSVVRAARIAGSAPAATTGEPQASHLLSVAKAVAALQVGEAW